MLTAALPRKPAALREQHLEAPLLKEPLERSQVARAYDFAPMTPRARHRRDGDRAADAAGLLALRHMRLPFWALPHVQASAFGASSYAAERLGSFLSAQRRRQVLGAWAPVSASRTTAASNMTRPAGGDPRTPRGDPGGVVPVWHYARQEQWGWLPLSCVARLRLREHEALTAALPRQRLPDRSRGGR